MNKSYLLRAFAASLTLSAGAALVGCNEDAKTAAPVAQANAVAREVCHDEVITRTEEPKDKDQLLGTAVGAIVGGVVGNQFGSGDGKKLATVGGAVAGGYAGNKIQENNQDPRVSQETKRVCETVYD
jgi:uncharacterized protein YcfJ